MTDYVLKKVKVFFTFDMDVFFGTFLNISNVLGTLWGASSSF